ncbi:family S53 protease-like protein [Epithele typhae]|uniref:family S53 protease-like protein n=1 Tax=Epithele typhae TaxID=378194 RepID=UPI00200872DC|nr:family S53 protease-like protein [Epithele typhae]KAH9914160.1 family S53 protease-like protein [Epithele typhae]
MAPLACVLALTLLSYLAVATPLSTPSKPSRSLRVHQARDAPPSGFALSSLASPSTPLTLRIALAQANPSAVVNALQSVSDPSSSSFRQHLSKADAQELAAPSSDSVDAVTSWLNEHGLTATALSPAGDWLGVNLTVSQANTLLAAEFSMFSHSASGISALRTLSYSIPASLNDHIDLIAPTTDFPEPIKSVGLVNKRAFHEPVLPRTSLPECSNGTTPACLQKLYNIPTKPAKVSTNRIGVTAHFGNNAHYTFLENFLKTFRPDMDPTTNFSVTLLDGGNNDQDVPSVSEGELDIQYTVGLATEVPVDFIMVGFNNTDGELEGYLDEINYLLSLDDPPQVLTTSYGFAEHSISFALTDKLCQAYAQLGARGVSVLFASGDSAVGCMNSNTTTFNPTFPSNCPYVTSVGGTQGSSPEQAWPGSSGGFSNYYPAPSYQVSAVSSYLAALGETNAGRFNTSGRAFPDISAQAADFRIAFDDVESVTGTSAASPTVGSIVALVNDRLAQAGKPPLGFLNPWLYARAKAAFTDITTGNSTIECNGEQVGFDAVEGWDPVTGLGTPDFNKLLKLAGL